MNDLKAVIFSNRHLSATHSPDSPATFESLVATDLDEKGAARIRDLASRHVSDVFERGVSIVPASSVPAGEKALLSSSEAQAALNNRPGDRDVVRYDVECFQDPKVDGVVVEDVNVDHAHALRKLFNAGADELTTAFGVTQANRFESEKDYAARRARELEALVTSRPDVGPVRVVGAKGAPQLFQGKGAVMRALVELNRQPAGSVRFEGAGGKDAGTSIVGFRGRAPGYTETGAINVSPGDHRGLLAFLAASGVSDAVAREASAANPLLNDFLPSHDYGVSDLKLVPVSAAFANRVEELGRGDGSVYFAEGSQRFMTGPGAALRALLQAGSEGGLRKMETVTKISAADCADRPLRLHYADREELKRAHERDGNKYVYAVQVTRSGAGGPDRVALVYRTQGAAEEMKSRLTDREGYVTILEAPLAQFLTPLAPRD